MKTGFTEWPAILFTCLFLASGIPAHSDTVNVGWDSDNGFSPSMVTINVGDTVTWTDNDPYLPTQVTSDNSIGDPNWFLFYLVDEGDVYEVAFDTAGTVGYLDSYGHSGTITINSAAPVTIFLTSPRRSSEEFIFDADGLTVGKTNVLEMSTNLVSWTGISTNVTTSSMMTFTNSVMPGHQFYRLVQMP